MKSVTLRILSSFQSQGDLLSRLVEAERLDTGEQGFLLASHCSSWPQALLPQATWLEGCFTPLPFADDPRLLLGYHPDDSCQMKVWREKGVGYVRFDLYEEEERTISVNMDSHLYPIREVDPKTTIDALDERSMRFLKRVWEISCRDYSLSGAVRNFYNAALGAVERGLIPIDCVRMAKHAVLNSSHFIPIDIRCRLERFDSAMLQGIGLIEVMYNSTSEGCYQAVQLLDRIEPNPLWIYGSFSASTTVNEREAAYWEPPNYAAALPVKLIETTIGFDGIPYEEVKAPAPELGFMPAVWFRTATRCGNVLTVRNDDFVNGYARAIDI